MVSRDDHATDRLGQLRDPLRYPLSFPRRNHRRRSPSPSPIAHDRRVLLEQVSYQIKQLSHEVRLAGKDLAGLGVQADWRCR